MRPRLQFLFAKTPSTDVVVLRRLAEFYGVECESVSLSQLLAQDHLSEPSGRVVDVASFTAEPRQGDLLRQFAERDSGKNPLLVLATKADPVSSEAIRHLTGNAINGVTPISSAESVRFTEGARSLTRELSGRSFSRYAGGALHLASNPDSQITPLMTVGAGPSFVTWGDVPGLRYVWSTPAVFDVFRPLAQELDFERALDACLPFLIFLRSAFGEACWHNPDRTAGFVIDDPLLTPEYGFIHFPRLLESARTNAYHVSLAFIPWNARRTKAKNVALFQQHAAQFSLCVHGCDHNNHEYGSADYDLLLDKNRVALDRMTRQTQRLGIPYTPLAVCPQEQCSLEGWRAFADNRAFLGMVNTGCLPRNTTNTTVCAADLLLPAQDALFGFPIFKRHYPGDMAPFALSLFLGRPAILVEHHDYFRTGLVGIETFARDLRQICPNVRWPGLHDLATTAHVRRRESDQAARIRFFTTRFQFSATDENPGSFHLCKRVADPGTVQKVWVNGRAVRFGFDDDLLTFEVTARQPETFQIHVELAPVATKPVYSFGPRYQAAVALRRTLSEFRDNVLSRNPRATSLAKSVMGVFRLTGSSVRRGAQTKQATRAGVPRP